MQRLSIPLLILPVAVPAAYLVYLSWKITSRTTISTGRAGYRDKSAEPAGPTLSPSRPISLPADINIDSSDSQWIVTYERVVSRPVPMSNIIVLDGGDAAVRRPDEDRAGLLPASLLQVYSRATHLAFRRTLQAKIMRAAISDAEVKRTFDVDWIRALPFQLGDVVNGGYKVVYHGPGLSPASERVELELEAPASYRGPPPPKGLILAEVQQVDGREDGEEPAVVFVNETWMWRRTDEKPTLIESGLGSFVHGLMAGWLVVNGVEVVT